MNTVITEKRRDRRVRGRTEEIYGRLKHAVDKSFPGSPLPSVKQIQRQYSAGQTTVIKAIQKLENNGLIVRKPRRGIFVADLTSRTLSTASKGRSFYPSWISIPREQLVFAIVEDQEIPLWTELINTFNKSRPHVPLIVKKYSALEIFEPTAGGKEIPDLVVFPHHLVTGDPLFDPRQWVDLTPFLATLNRGDYYPQAFVRDQRGKIWGASPYVTSAMMFCNEDLFRKSGVKKPGLSWSWEELFHSAVKIKKALGEKGPQWSFIPMGYINYLSYRGIPFYDRQTGIINLNTAEIKQAIGLLKRMVVEEKIMPLWSEIVTGCNSWEAFLEGKTAMLEGFSYFWKYAHSKIDIGVAPVPLNNGGTHKLSISPVCINSTSLNIDESWDFIRFVLSEQGQNIVSAHTEGLPSQRDFLPKDLCGDRLHVQMQAVETGELFYAQYPYVFPVMGVIESAVERYLRAGGDLERILQDAEVVCQWQIDKHKNRREVCYQGR